MRIAYLSPSSQMGGAERSLIDILVGIRHSVSESSLHLLLGSEGPVATKARALGVRTMVLPFPPALAHLGEAGIGAWRLLTAGHTLPRYFGELRRALQAIAPHLIHSIGFKTHLLSAWARPRNTPVIWHAHDYVSPRPVTSRLMRASAKRCAAVVANSNSVAEDVRAVFGTRPTVHTVLNGVDLEEFSPAGPTLDLDALAGLPAAGRSVIKVGLVATMARWKGHHIFIDALSRLPTSAHVRGYIIGDAIYQTAGSQCSIGELRRFAIERGVAARVGFTGFVQEPAAAMRVLDIVVHASTAPEPFGLVVAEAMACGRPVVLSAASGVAEALVPERDALLYPPGDTTALAQCIARLAADHDLRVRLGHQARTAAIAAFDRQRVSAEVMSVYRGLLAARR